MVAMTSSIQLGRVLGIPVGVHWGALIVAGLFAVSLATSALASLAPGAAPGIRFGVASVGVVVFFACILAHEIGHAVVALRHGVAVEGITLWVLGGMAKLERQPPTAKAELQIAVAGPAVSMALGAFFAALAIIGAAVADGRLLIVVLSWLAGVNLILGVFNLLPAAPLDGGRVLSALLWRRSGDAEGARITAARCGLVLGLIMVAGGVYLLVFLSPLQGVTNLAIGTLVYLAAASEIVNATLRRRLTTTTVGELHTPHPFAVADTAMVHQLLLAAGPHGGSTAHPVTRWDQQPIGYVVPDWAASLSEPERTWTPVGALMIGADRIGAALTTEPVAHVLDRLSDSHGVLRTHDRAGAHPVGTLTDRQIRPLLTPPTLWGTDRRPRTPPASSTAITDREQTSGESSGGRMPAGQPSPHQGRTIG
jgi:Zn-dependent protease